MEASQFQQYLEVMKKQIEKSVAEAVPKAVDISVNGKVNGMRKELSDYITVDNQWKHEDRQWKDNAQPVINMGKDIQAGNRIISWIATFVASLGSIYGIYLLLKSIIRK